MILDKIDKITESKKVDKSTKAALAEKINIWLRWHQFSVQPKNILSICKPVEPSEPKRSRI